MLNHTGGQKPAGTGDGNVVLIFKSTPLKVAGRWHLLNLNADEANAESINNSSFDYLVNVRGANYLIHPLDLPGLKDMLGEKPKEPGIQFRVVTPAGQVKLLIRTTENADEGSHIQTDPVKADTEAIIASKNLLEAVFNTSTLGLHVLRSIRNEAGVIIDFHIALTNKTSEKIAGRTVSGLRMLEGWPHTREIGLFDKFVSTVETGKSVTYEHLYEGDGVRAWFQWIASKFHDGLYVTIEDITLRKDNEEALKHTADRLQSTFDGVPALIGLLEVVFDADQTPVDFIISAANKALSDFTGCDVHELIGKKMTDLYPEAFRGQLQESYLRVFLTGEPWHLEFLHPQFDRWFSILVTKQVDGKGVVAVALEITEQKKNEDQRKQNQLLAELDQAKMEFFSNVSHEFRTPLTLMLGPLNDILKKFEGNNVYSEEIPKLQMVKRNTLRLQKLVNSLLDFTSVEAGKTDVVFQPTDIAEYTTLLAGNFRAAIENAGLTFCVDCESTEPVYINQDMWEKIVLNLLSNAFKFTFEGKIELSVKSYKKQVQLRVSDTGIGISDTDLPKIFERFTRVQNTRARIYEGTGIGLALVQELVKVHGGTIKVKSTIDKGTVFVVSIPKGKAHLPARNVHELREKKGVSPLSAIYEYEAMSWIHLKSDGMKSREEMAWNNNNLGGPAQGQKKLVLIVDDNSDIREYIKCILHTRYLVATANNGKQALELITGGLRPDLILADIMMPEMDGYSLLSSIKEHKHFLRVPFIILSAKASEHARVEGITRGADDYLIKPFSGIELLARVDSRLNVSVRSASGL